MNVSSNAVNTSILTQQPAHLFEPQQTFPAQTPWISNNSCGSHQLPLQLSQYYNVFPEVPSTNTSWSFPNGCVTSSIVRFTGLPTPTYPVGSHQQLDQCRATGITPIKRKSLILESDTQPSKIFISEEKMAARMNEMHISSNFVAHITNNINNSNFPRSFQSESLMDDELPETNNEQALHPRFVICDELKELNKNLGSFIPEQLVPLEKPTTALVVWKPPISYLKVVKVDDDEEELDNTTSSVVITDITDRPDLDNNNISTLDFNSLNKPSVEYPPDTLDSMELS